MNKFEENYFKSGAIDDLLWLEKAESKTREGLKGVFTKGSVISSMDGFRIHQVDHSFLLIGCEIYKNDGNYKIREDKVVRDPDYRIPGDFQKIIDDSEKNNQLDFLVNPKYLKDALEIFSDRHEPITIKLGDKHAPIFIEGKSKFTQENVKVIIMPMAIEE